MIPVQALQYNIFTDRSTAVLLLCIICVFVVLCFSFFLLLFIAALWSPDGKGLTSRPLLVMFVLFCYFPNVVSLIRCGT